MTKFSRCQAMAFGRPDKKCNAKAPFAIIPKDERNEGVEERGYLNGFYACDGHAAVAVRVGVDIDGEMVAVEVLEVKT